MCKNAIPRAGPDSTRRPKRVLHVVGRLDPGGIETWLLNLLRHIDRDRMHWDFVAHTRQPGMYDDEIRVLGARIFTLDGPRLPWLYGRRLARLINLHGPYDIVHSHVHRYSAFVLRVAQRVGVPHRIAHSHVTVDEDAASPARRLYALISRSLIDRHATLRLAAGSEAGRALFGDAFTIVRYGVCLDSLARPFDRIGICRELGLDPEGLIIGHVGRFHPQKNHRFLLEVAAAVIRRRPDACLLLIGHGFLQAEIEQQAQTLGIRERVVFAGLRREIPRIMRDAMDVFLLPSLYEGFGIVVLEAQAAGVPIVASLAVPVDAFVVPGLGLRMSLDQPAEMWAAAVLEMANRTAECRMDALAAISDSPFTLERSVASLVEAYGGY